MAQQPNLEITEATAPRRTPEPGHAVKWRADKPGVPASPADVPVGGRFGAAGPDAGWGVRMVNSAELPEDDPRLKQVVTGLVLARASASGRAPVPEDVAVALVLCGYYVDAPPKVIERRQLWLAAVPHEARPGMSAVADVDRDLLVKNPDQVRYALNTRL